MTERMRNERKRQRGAGAGSARTAPVRAFSVLMLAMLLVFAGGPVVRADKERPLVVDDAGLFTSGERARLEQEARSAGEEIGAELVIVSTDRSGRSGTSYARVFLLDGGYGSGSGREAIVLLIGFADRVYTVYEYNRKASGYLLTDYEGDCILDDLEADLHGGNYFDAARSFLEDCVYYAGTDLGGNYEGSGLHERGHGINWLICLVIGLCGGALVTGLLLVNRNGDAKTSAAAYMKHSSFHLKEQKDLYLNTTTVSRRIEQDSGGNRHGGGSDRSGGSGGFSGGNSGGGHGGSRGF